MHPGVETKYKNLEKKPYGFVDFIRKAGNIIIIKSLIIDMIRL